jgi:hypothetical protein
MLIYLSAEGYMDRAGQTVERRSGNMGEYVLIRPLDISHIF